MKKNGFSNALLMPDAHGWRVRIPGGEDKALATLDEAIEAVPSGAHLELALPWNSVLLERHKFPATDRAELADMLQLQLEKTLPFPVEDVSHGFEVLGQDENESTVLSVAAPHAQLDQICAPLRNHGRLPERITLNPDCGFAPGSAAVVSIDEVYTKLKNEVAAARRLRKKYA